MASRGTPVLHPQVTKDLNPVNDIVPIHGIGAGGVGVGALPDGRVVFVPRTAPGDRVRIRLVKEKARFAHGRVLDLVEAGEGRVEPPCSKYSECDGCSVQHLAYPEQIRWKARIVGDALRRVGRVSVDDPEITPSPMEFRYRNRVTYTLRRLRGGGVVAGFRCLDRPTRVLDLVDDCLLPDETLAKCWRSIRTHWGPGARNLPAGGEVRLTLRMEGKGVALVIRGGRGAGDPEALLETVPELVSIWHQPSGGSLQHLAGADSLTIGVGTSRVEVDGGVFTQVNPGALELLRSRVLAEVGDPTGLRVVDAYCGPGTWGRATADLGGEVVGIDLDPGPSGNLDIQGPGSYRVVAGSVDEELETVLPADLVILNPPRSGIGPSVPEILNRHLPARVIYVSCDPATLARDLGRMTRHYTLTGLHSFDLFPQTAHVETVASLGLKKDNPPAATGLPDEGQEQAK